MCRRLTLGRDIGWGCRCASSCDLFALPKCVHLPYLRHLSLMTNIWIAATEYYMHFYIIVLFPLINFTASYFLVY